MQDMKEWERLLFSHNTAQILPLSRSGDAVHHLHDTMKGGVCADGHVCATEVIIDGSNHANDVKMGRWLRLLFSDLAWKSSNEN